jgi:hypothetical protein
MKHDSLFDNRSVVLLRCIRKADIFYNYANIKSIFIVNSYPIIYL